jgi:hypothetical protein
VRWTRCRRGPRTIRRLRAARRNCLGRFWAGEGAMIGSIQVVRGRGGTASRVFSWKAASPSRRRSSYCSTTQSPRDELPGTGVASGQEMRSVAVIWARAGGEGRERWRCTSKWLVAGEVVVAGWKRMWRHSLCSSPQPSASHAVTRGSDAVSGVGGRWVEECQDRMAQGQVGGWFPGWEPRATVQEGRAKGRDRRGAG